MKKFKQIETNNISEDSILYLNSTNNNSLLKMDNQPIMNLMLNDNYPSNCGVINVSVTKSSSVEGDVEYTFEEVYKFNGATPTLSGNIITVNDTQYEGAFRITAKANNAQTSKIILIKPNI